MSKKFYLGDGVYVEFDGAGLTLTTENGIEVTNTIILESEVYSNLLLFVRDLKGDDDDGREAQDNTPSKGPFV